METSARLRQALAQRNLSKRGLARKLIALQGKAGDPGALEMMERNVYRWTDGSGAGMSDEYAELVAQALDLPLDHFKPQAVIAALEEENRGWREVSERVERLERGERAQAERLDELERLLGELLKRQDAG